jgi:hypothetical protein
MRLAQLLLAGALAFAPAAPALAQDSSARSIVQHLKPAQAAAFSKQIERELAGKDARLAIVFRTGRPRAALPEGISYTHGAFWVHRQINAADGRKLSGYAVYNLYMGDGKTLPRNRSQLVQDWPFDFTRGSAADDVAVIIPSPGMQRRLLRLLDSPTYPALHNPNYSLIANPWAGKYQNCNGFMLDVIAAASWNTADPAKIRANLKAHYRPTVVKAGPLMRLFGPMADSTLRTDDQQGPLRTSTYESISAFMQANGLLQQSYVLKRAVAPT